ncbi:MAG: class I SAM-dependent methyltransferase [Vicinamibacterales bacterium]
MADRAIRTVSVEDLARLKREREEADARYNAALTAVDAAVLQVGEVPHPPPGPDEHQITPLNQGWDILRHAPPAAGWRGRLAAFVWRTLTPALDAQQRFNAALVDHVNRSVPRERAVSEAIAASIGFARRQVEAASHFQSLLVLFLQTVTPFVDTKDYEFAGLGRRTSEDGQVALARLDDIARGLAAGLSGLSDEMLKRYETLLGRDQRYDTRLTDLSAALATLQQTSLALKREIARVQAEGLVPAVSGAPAAAAPAPPAGTDGGSQQMLASDRVHSHQYSGFEDVFRGTETEIRTRLADYVPIFSGAADVVDVGCGRGEFLELLRQAGVTARGIDLNHDMVERCHAHGFDVTETDALSFVAGAAPGSLGGLIATQVVEHLQPDYLLRLLSAAADALRPGAPIVLETINPACWSAFFDSYVRDLTHVRPVHPDTLKFLVTAAGFAGAEIQWRSPYPDGGKLQRIPAALREASRSDHTLAPLVEAIDRNVDRLNALFFTYRDYAVVARRP